MLFIILIHDFRTHNYYIYKNLYLNHLLIKYEAQKALKFWLAN